MKMLQHLPSDMLHAVDLLPTDDKPVILFTRHSLREVVRGIGLAGYDLQLTIEGRELARAWGEYLSEQTNRQIVNCLSSPIQRCVDTAELMIHGAKHMAHHHKKWVHISQESLLVEPGSYVVDINQAAPYFAQQGAVKFIHSFVQNQIPGMKHPIAGVLDILKILYQAHLQPQFVVSTELSIAVSHDTIISAVIAVISQTFQVDEENWPKMMEGLFIWFEDTNLAFEHNVMHWVWRGKQAHIAIADLIAQLND